MNINIDKVIKLRKEKGISIKKLSALLDVSTRTIYNWESGKSYPSKAELTAIAHLLNVRLCDISNFKDLPFIYSKPSLLPKSSGMANAEQLNSIIGQYKSIEDFNPYPILKVMNENIRLSTENKRLEAKAKRYESILNCMHCIVYAKEAKGNIRYYNKYFLNIVPDSFKEENIIGSKFSDIFPTGELESLTRTENSVFQNGQTVTDKEINISFSGNKRRYSVSVMSISEDETSVYEIAVALWAIGEKS